MHVYWLKIVILGSVFKWISVIVFMLRMISFKITRLGKYWSFAVEFYFVRVRDEVL